MTYKESEQEFPSQHQESMPGSEKEMTPAPLYKGEWYKGSGKLKDKVAIITGGDSGIGRSVAIFFAREGADVAIVYLNEHEDARETAKMVEAEGRKSLLVSGDVSDESFCSKAVEKTIHGLGRIDILVNNAAQQFDQESLEGISKKQLEKTFATNIFAYFYMAKACLKHLKEGSAIINTASVAAYRGNQKLIDYSSTKSAIVGFTRSLAHSLVDKGIRVNGVAPGPIWTPLIPSTFEGGKVENFGKEVPMKRAGHPEEVAPAYVFLASRDSSYITGQFIHPNGGETLNT